MMTEEEESRLREMYPLGVPPKFEYYSTKRRWLRAIEGYRSECPSVCIMKIEFMVYCAMGILTNNCRYIFVDPKAVRGMNIYLMEQALEDGLILSTDVMN